MTTRVVDLHIEKGPISKKGGSKIRNVKDWMIVEGNLYCGRSIRINLGDNLGVYVVPESEFKNPFKVTHSDELTVRLADFLKHARATGLNEKIKAHKGKVFGCWCTNDTTPHLTKPENIRCHAQILAKMAEGLDKELDVLLAPVNDNAKSTATSTSVDGVKTVYAKTVITKPNTPVASHQGDYQQPKSSASSVKTVFARPLSASSSSEETNSHRGNTSRRGGLSVVQRGGFHASRGKNI